MDWHHLQIDTNTSYLFAHAAPSADEGKWRGACTEIERANPQQYETNATNYNLRNEIISGTELSQVYRKLADALVITLSSA